MLGNFLDIVLPPFLLLAAGIALVSVNAFYLCKRARLWDAQRKRMQNADHLITLTTDLLALLVSEEAAGLLSVSEATEARITDVYQQLRETVKEREEPR